MNRIIFTLFFLCSIISVFAQDAKHEIENTKYDSFVSKTGMIHKYVDVNTSKIETQYSGYLKPNIRTIINDSGNYYFYKIEFQDPSTKVRYKALIEFSDVKEIIRALERLMSDFLEDQQYQPDYMENKFVSVDGFIIGYYINGKSSQWFMQLNQSSSSTVFVRSPHILSYAFKEALNTIEELMECSNIMEYKSDPSIIQMQETRTQNANEKDNNSSKQKIKRNKNNFENDDIYF